MVITVVALIPLGAIIHSAQPIDSKSTYNSCRWHSLFWPRWRRWWWGWWELVVTLWNGSWVTDVRSRRRRKASGSTASFRCFPTSAYVIVTTCQITFAVDIEIDALYSPEEVLVSEVETESCCWLCTSRWEEETEVSSLKRTKSGWRLACRSLRLKTCRSIGLPVAETAVTKKPMWVGSVKARRLRRGSRACVTLKICQPSTELST